MIMESRIRRRRHIPPSKLKDKSPKNTEELLQKKLDTAEKDTGHLMKQLSQLGFAPEKMSQTKSHITKDSKTITPLSPHTSGSVDTHRLHESYEGLVTRVCKAESQVQTLKLNLCALQAEKDIYGTEADKIREQLQAQEEKQEKNERKLKSELEQCKRDLEKVLSEKRDVEDELTKMREKSSRLALKQSASSESQCAAQEEDKMTSQRMARKLSELKEELSHEVSLRKSLEDSHATLLQRIQDTEDVVERERNEMQKLINVYTKLTEDNEKMREQKAESESRVSHLQEKVKKFSAELGMRDIRLAETLRDNQAAVAAADKMKRQRIDLQQQLEELKTKYKILETQRDQDTLSKLSENANMMKDKHSSELREARMEIDTLKREIQTLEAEKRRLEERICAVEEQEVVHQKVGASIAELMEDKKRLAYEKGQLQERLNAMQREVEDAVRTVTENNHLRKTKTALEGQVKKTSEELTAAQVLVHQLRSQLRQEQNTADMKERDFEMAIQARDAAMKETEGLSHKLDEREYQDQIKVSGLQKSLADAQADHSKMAAMLDSVMASHHNLQSQIEALQTELGRKDRELSSARQERQDSQRNVHLLRDNLQKLQATERSKENETLMKVKSLQRELSLSQEDNRNMGQALEELSSTNLQLQAALDGLEGELQKQKQDNQILRDKKETENLDSSNQMEMLRERVNSLQGQLINQKSLVNKQTQKELASLRRAHGELASRVSDLSKTNTELNKKLSGMQETRAKLQDRIKSQRAQLESYRTMRDENESLKEETESLKGQLTVLQEAKRRYVQKNKEQMSTIKSFMEQVNHLQRDIEEMSKKSQDLQKTEASDENKDHNEMKREIASLRAKLNDTELHKSKLEMKLAEISSESEEISFHVEEANDWFRQKCEGLQRELLEASKDQTSLREVVQEQARELRKEKLRSDEQTKRAYQIIRSSRVALGRLAGDFERDKIESKSQMKFLVRRVQAERDHASYMEKKYNNVLDSSANCIEELAMELDQTRNLVESIR